MRCSFMAEAVEGAQQARTGMVGLAPATARRAAAQAEEATAVEVRAILPRVPMADTVAITISALVVVSPATRGPLVVAGAVVVTRRPAGQVDRVPNGQVMVLAAVEAAVRLARMTAGPVDFMAEAAEALEIPPQRRPMVHRA